MSAKENFEVIFRGVRKRDNKIVFGYYYYDEVDNIHFIKYPFEVDYVIHPESLAMWTGETDKNEKMIFGGIGTGKDKGGDICKRMEGDCDGIKQKAIYKMLYSDTEYSFVGEVIKSNMFNRGSEVFVMVEFEVIGNAFLNPELLEV